MKVTITIDGVTKGAKEASENWINQEINRLRRSGLPVCVVVNIDSDGVSLTLPTSDCPRGGGGGGRLPNLREQEILNLWKKRQLDTPDFASGNVVAFLKQLRQLT